MNRNFTVKTINALQMNIKMLILIRKESKMKIKTIQLFLIYPVGKIP